MKTTKYGLDIERELLEQSEKDWVMGAASVICLAPVPLEDRASYLPAGEVQRGVDDMMDCASRAPVNILETKFNWLLRNRLLTTANESWLWANGYITAAGYVQFSDAFIAILSGTTKSGNSLKAPLETIRTMGMIPKSKLPLNPSMTWEQYHNPDRVTEELLELGKEFKRRFTINYDKVYAEYFNRVLEEDLLDVAGYAWPTPVNNIYPKVDLLPNHAFVAFGKPLVAIFDNYTEAQDDYIKQLAPDYEFLNYGYRIYITKQNTILNQTWLQKLIRLIRGL